MGLAAGAQFGIPLFTFRIPDNAGSRPVIERVAEPLITASAHEHDLLFAALMGDGRGAA